MEVFNQEKTMLDFQKIKDRKAQRLDIDVFIDMVLEQIQLHEKSGYKRYSENYGIQNKWHFLEGIQNCETHDIYLIYQDIIDTTFATDALQQYEETKKYAYIEDQHLEQLFKSFPYLETIWNGYLNYRKYELLYKRYHNIQDENKCQKKYMKNLMSYQSYWKQ